MKGIAVATVLAALPAAAEEGVNNSYIQQRLTALDSLFGDTVALLEAFLFADFGTGFPLIVVILLFGGVYYSLYFRWLSFRGFKHSIDIIRGRYDSPDDPGEISHFQALSSALSATIGLGNIAGVAIAVSLGGPGAVFWMIVTAVFGMSSKLASCTLAVMYRRVHSDGRVSGGPMYYLEEGLAGIGKAEFGRTLAVIFAFLTIGGSLGGGNMFQANQTLEILSTVSPWFKSYNWIVGLIMAFFVGLVIIGGIRRIGRVTSRIVPFMCVLYVVSSLLIILLNITEVPAMIGRIISDAFTGPAMYGGFAGVLVMGIRRAAFSNEAGLGSAAFAHAAARTDEPAREGMVAMIGPFIDTIVICTMTALVCMITGAYQLPEFQTGEFIVGARMTAAAFDSVVPGARYVLAAAVILFAYSTMISWSYYGERAWEYLFGSSTILLYRLIFVGFVFLGAVTALNNVLGFSDMMILGMAFPNIVGGVLLSPKIREVLDDYWERLQSGIIKPYK
ncbi:MAG: alanine/glycine:cation symporter family protein [Candidatus Latescibacterota bacterium]|nr:alanine/glycine:cation symporter family protein [Candidatus Latescibacterota bacterium]